MAKYSKAFWTANTAEMLERRAYYAVFIAIIAIMTFIPSLGYITVGGISITILHVVVLIAAFK